MKKEHSLGKKLLALILSGILVVGSIPIALATDDSTKDETDSEVGAPATADEAVGAGDYPKIEANEGVAVFEDAADSNHRAFVDSKDLTELTAEFIPANRLREDIKNDISTGDYERISVYCSVFGASERTDIKDKCEFGMDGSVMSVKIYDPKSVMTHGDYILTVMYNDGNSDSHILDKNISLRNEDDDAPELKNVVTSGGVENWAGSDVDVAFEVVTQYYPYYVVKYGDTEEENINSFTVKESGDYEITVEDGLHFKSNTETLNIKIDRTAPNVTDRKFYDSNNQVIEGWASEATIKAVLQVEETESGLDASSVKVNGEAVATVENNSISFEVEANKDYTVTGADKVGNEFTYTINKEDIKIDTAEPAAADFTLTFDTAETTSDKLLSVLTFGAYTCTDLKIKVDVDDHGEAEIPSENIVLYNGETVLEKNDGWFILPCAAEDGSAVEADLYVEATDAAGNTSGKVRFNDSPIVAKSVADSDYVKKLDTPLYEVICSKVIPENKKFEITGSKVKKIGDMTYVSSDDAVVTITAEEKNTGIGSMTVTLNGEQVTPTFSDTDTSKKIESQTATYALGALPEGDYAIAYIATANSGKSLTKTLDFKVAKNGPKQEGKIELSNMDESGNQKWFSTVENSRPVTGTVKFVADPFDVSKVTYYNSTLHPTPSASDIKEAAQDGDIWTFEAEEYGVYTITAYDEFNNYTTTSTGEPIKIDNEDPVVYNDKFYYSSSWSNQPVEVSFDVVDKPTKNCSGDLKVTVDGKDAPVEGTVCKFDADHYGSYEVVVTDGANNSSTYTVGPVRFDGVAPGVDKVEFSTTKNDKDFGEYNNSDITMTITVSDPFIVDNTCSGIDTTSFELRENGEKLEDVKCTSVGPNSAVFKYPVKNSENIREFTYFVQDRAGNAQEYKLINNKTVVEADDEAKSYEVVATLLKPTISEIGVDFTQGPEPEGGNYYSGEGKFTASITDNISGIDKYSCYFVQTSEVKFDSDGNVKSIKGDACTTVTDVSKDEKVTSVPKIEFETGSIESGEYTAVVWAKNLSGNEIYQFENIIVDNTVPQITGFEITTNGGANDTINKDGLKGIYTSQSVKIKMNYTDDPCSVGIKSTQFYNDGTAFGAGDKDTELLTEDGRYLISALVTDKFGHKLDSAQDIKDAGLTVTVNGNPITVPGDNFEIVINSDPEELDYSSDKPDYDFDYPKDKNDSNNEKNIFSSLKNGKGDIFTTVKNELSGIKSLTAVVKNRDTNGAEPVNVTLSDSSDSTNYATDKYGKITKQKITVDASGLSSGSYHVEFTAVDWGGVSHSISDDFYIDKTIPVYKGMEIGKLDSSQNVGGQVLNILTFGLYSNDSLKVTVKFEDPGPSAGMEFDGIVLSSINGKKVDAKKSDFTETTNGDYGKKEYEKVFTLGKTDNYNDAEHSFYNDLKLDYQDKYENSNNMEHPTDVTADNKTITLDGHYDIVASSLAPKFTEDNLVGNDGYPDSRGVWYSNKPEFTFSASDEVSKIHSMSVKINNSENQELNCTYNNGEQYTGPFTDFENGTGSPVEEIKEVKLDSNAVAQIKEGKNKITVTVTGNNGVTSNPLVKEFYVDTTTPVIQKFEFADPQTGESVANAKELGVVNTNYGYFFKDQTTVTVTATDDIEVEGSGVNTISFYGKAVDGNDIEVTTKAAVNNQASFTIPQNFKGQIYAYAIDNVKNGGSGRNMRVFTPDSVITETQSQHNTYSSIAITPTASTDVKDHKGYRLYKSNVTLTLVAESRFAGLKSITTTVTSQQNQTDKFNGTGYVSLANQTVTDGWTTVDTDKNLVTRVQKQITVDIDSNDIQIEVEILDNCGNTSKHSEIISIDKTAPHIDVQFSPAEGNKITNGDYYKTDRVATVTITERNFNPDDYKFTITNTDGSIPSLSPGDRWNTSYSTDVDDPDSITHIATITFHADGDYNMESEFTDLAGNEADNNHKKEAEFTVDQTIPVITISFDQNNSTPYYNSTRTATIRIEEHNFYDGYVDVKQTAYGADNSTPASPPSVSGWSTSGNVSTATITFASDGKYSFTVDFKDKALNDAVQQKADEFYIDTKIDKIEIVNVEDMTAYDDTIAPEIHYFDNNFESATYNLKRIDINKTEDNVDNIIPSDSAGGGYSKLVSYPDFDRITENDGIYTLSADITDRAGNKDHKDVLFSVNRFGSTFMITDEETKELVEDKFYTQSAPDIKIIEINVNEVTDPEVQVSRGDSSQNLEKDSQFTVSASGDERTWYSYEYSILKDNFADDGNYDVKVSSKDHFDKVVSNKGAYKSDNENRTCPIAFVVDTIAPVVTISGIDSNEYYSEAEKEVIVNCDDANITTEDMSVTFDGEEFTDYEMTETSGNIELRLNLQADGNDKNREFVVKVRDKAGNQNIEDEGGEIHDFKLGASWLQRLLHYNLPIVIIVGALVLGGIAFAVIMAVRRNKKKAAQ